MIQHSGFSVRNGLFAVDQCARLLAALGAIPTGRSRAGTRHLLRNPVIVAAARSDVLTQLAREVVGASAIPFRATYFDKSLLTNWLIPWHQDTALPMAQRFESPEWGPWSEKGGICYAHAPAWALERVVALRLHLDPCTEDNGPLRVIEGSHLAGLLSDAEVLRYANERPQQTCVVECGGVLAMRPLLIHASSKATSADPRRVLHIEYADALELAPGIRLAVA